MKSTMSEKLCRLVMLASIEGHNLREVGLLFGAPRGDRQIESVSRPEGIEATVVMTDADRASTSDVTLDQSLSAVLSVEPAPTFMAQVRSRIAGDARLMAEVR